VIPPRFSTLPDWLAWMETLHPSGIDLGLERIGEVAVRLGISVPSKTKLITVAGTNGKGSCVAALEYALGTAGYQVASYTSPHLFKYNERIRIDGSPVDDETLCRAFAEIDAARGDISLTYFEFGTLAAFVIFSGLSLDYWVLEVGLGGRLDAVNLYAPDIAVITSIDLDHQDWLGDTRDAIAKEKAGILREGVLCVCAEPNPPSSMLAIIEQLNVRCLYLGKDFGFSLIADDARCDMKIAKNFSGSDYVNLSLGLPRLPLPSVAAALQVLALENVDIQNKVLCDDLSDLGLNGRFFCQTFDHVPYVFDVAHNPAAGVLLAENVRRQQWGDVHVVVGMMADKNIRETLRPLVDLVSSWTVCQFDDVARSASAEQLYDCLVEVGVSVADIEQCDGLESALVSVERRYSEFAVNTDSLHASRVLVFGSFITVAKAVDFLSENAATSSH